MSVEEAKANGTYDTQFMNIESWWYGTNDKINDSNQISTGVPTNYTERWLLVSFRQACKTFVGVAAVARR